MNRTPIRVVFTLACLSASVAFARTARSDDPGGAVGTYQIASAPAAAEPVSVQSASEPNSFVLLFNLDSSEITPYYLRNLRYEASIWMKSRSKLLVTCHADRAGMEAYNWELSKRRCKAVHDALVSFGMDPRLLILWPRGETAPAAETPDGVKELVNRFVRIQYCDLEKERPDTCD
jgi:outer membrane protein OmpA-like peptidoglycan-associated protein